MTIPYLTHQEFITLLKQNGWEIVSDTDWETHNRIMIGKGGHTFPLQIKQTYYFPQVVKLCESLGINPPEDHLKCVEQYREYKKASRESDKKE
ncbi:hypothetical protein BH09BAC5_BH09BAC5_06230 [soil metagenome]